MAIRFTRLTAIEKSEIMELMNHPLVRRHLPLLKGNFTESDCSKFISAKESLWTTYGYGPWALVVNGKFAGWGGLQHEDGEADLALVLHPHYWGLGKILYQEIMRRAFGEMGLQSVTVLFPATRTRISGLLRLGFEKVGVLGIDNVCFIRYRLSKPVANDH